MPFALRVLAYHFKNFTDDCILEMTPQFENLLLRSTEDRSALSFMIPALVYDYQWWTADERDVPAIITLDTTALALAMANHKQRVAADVTMRRQHLAEQGIERVPPHWRPEFEMHEPVVGCLGCAYWSTRVAEMTEKIGDARDKMAVRRDILVEKSDTARNRAMAFQLLSLMGEVDSNNPPDDDELMKHSVKLDTAPAGDTLDNRATAASPELPDSLPEDEDEDEEYEYEYEDEDEDGDDDEDGDQEGSHNGQEVEGAGQMAAGANEDGGVTDFSTEFSD